MDAGDFVNRAKNAHRKSGEAFDVTAALQASSAVKTLSDDTLNVVLPKEVRIALDAARDLALTQAQIMRLTRFQEACAHLAHVAGRRLS